MKREIPKQERIDRDDKIQKSIEQLLNKWRKTNRGSKLENQVAVKRG